MKFIELKVGTKFKIAGSSIVFTKVTACQAHRKGELLTCSGTMECLVITDSDSENKEFGELAIGARFRFVSGKLHFVKLSDNSYHCVDPNCIMSSNCSKDKECVPVFEPRELTFKDLEIGAEFQFPGNPMKFTKTGTDQYCGVRCGGIDLDTVVEPRRIK